MLDLAVVEVEHLFCWEEFICVTEGLDCRLEFFHDFKDGAVVFEVVLHHNSELFDLFLLTRAISLTLSSSCEGVRR